MRLFLEVGDRISTFEILRSFRPPFVDDGARAVANRVSLVRIFSAICMLIGSTNPNSAQEAMYGLRYCAPPAVPKCIDVKETYGNKSSVALCEAEVSRYVRAAVSYRDCLLRESQRAIVQANDAIDRLKCATNPACCGRSGSCPSPQH
jgi:hypothetical protein